MPTDAPKKRGPKPKHPPKTALEVIKPPQNTNAPTTVELPPGDNNKYTSFALDVMRLPKIDVYQSGSVQPRILEYLQLCADYDMKPALTGVALAVGISRQRLWEISVDHPGALKIPQENKDAIKQYYSSAEFMWENMMQNGKINPVSGIFLGKNNFGYKDQQEYVLTPNQTANDINPEDLAAKYKELPED